MFLKRCKKCEQELSLNVKVCPACGTKTNKINIVIFFFIIIIFGVITVFGAILFNNINKELFPSRIESKCNSLNIFKISEYSSSLKGTSITWKGKVMGTKKNNAIPTLFTVDVKINYTKNLHILFETSQEEAASLKKGSIHKFTGEIVSVGSLLGITMVQLNSVTVKD